MTKQKVNWDDIPSLEGLEVDWQFKPENPLGKRAWVRIVNNDLFPLLDVKKIPVKVVAKTFNGQGLLSDISQSGLAVVLQERLVENQQVKVGLFLGKQKIVSGAVVRNVRVAEDGYRTGMEFVNISKDYESFIIGLISSKGYRSQG
ncbi:MAG: PilZ domain-containing protein [Desulforhopalus sp.]